MSAIAEVFASLPDLAAFSFVNARAATAPSIKALLVVAHPDDESECAAFLYRITHELGGIADQIVVTNGEGGRSYAAPAAHYYGLPLHKKEGRSHLIRVRQKEQLRANRSLGIRRTYFLGQTDTGATSDVNEAMCAWDTSLVKRQIAQKLCRENYDLVLVLLPFSGTHAHHKAVAILTLEAISELPPPSQPVVLGATTGDPQLLSELAEYPSVRPIEPEPVWCLDRCTPLRCAPALNYSLIVNWAISEHKSQGFFQMEGSQRSHEYFWLFGANGEAARLRWQALLKEIVIRF
jgi:LmbE family N-acetylglucosaminyl deacetylase